MSIPNANSPVHIVGAGLAGSECAYQLAQRGHRVILYEMRPEVMTPAHRTGGFAELVCSNSFGSQSGHSAPGQLKWEAEKLGSLILKAGRQAYVPAGQALGVDREVFSQAVTQALREHPLIEISPKVIESLDQLPRPCVIATGPLTHESLARSLQQHFGDEFLYFFDAIAPIIDAESINTEIAWKGDRWDLGTKDYYNCPLTMKEYLFLVNQIREARKVEPKEFEKTPYFEGCMPIEAMVERGEQTLRFGPMSGKGLRDPRTGKFPYACVQLRQENKEGTAYNMVGFQTKMAYGEQQRIFRLIPGLENAEFLKLGSIHRNLYINSTMKLTSMLASRKDPWLFLAGQITGVEGYFESTCIGLLVGMMVSAQLRGETLPPPPRTTAFGSLLNALTGEEKSQFQPTNINFGLFPPSPAILPNGEKSKEARRDWQIQTAQADLMNWMHNLSTVAQNFAKTAPEKPYEKSL